MSIDSELLPFLEEFPPLELGDHTVRDIRDELRVGIGGASAGAGLAAAVGY